MAKGGKYRDGRGSNRPPEEFQFKPGKSGNIKGRPLKPPPSMIAMIADELNSKHSIEIGGRQVELPLKNILIKQVLRLACKGDPKMLVLALEMIELIQRSEVRRHSEPNARLEITREKLAKMTEQEKIDLYRKTLKETGREPFDDLE